MAKAKGQRLNWLMPKADVGEAKGRRPRHGQRQRQMLKAAETVGRRAVKKPLKAAENWGRAKDTEGER